jgi:hypothetical protein
MPTFHSDIHDWLRNLQSFSGPIAQSFTADMSDSYPQLQLRFVSRAFYGEALTEEVSQEFFQTCYPDNAV